MRVESNLGLKIIGLVARRLRHDWRDIAELFSSPDTRPPTIEDQLKSLARPTAGDRPTIAEQTKGFINPLGRFQPRTRDFTNNKDRIQALVDNGDPDKAEKLSKEIQKD